MGVVLFLFYKMEEEKQSQNHADGNSFYILSHIDETFGKDILQPFIKKVQEYTEPSCTKCATKPELHIYISSEGGAVYPTLDLITWIEKAKSKGMAVNTYVTSTACSAASMIAVSGSKRYISTRAFHLLHYARGGSWSHNPEMITRNAENSHFLQTELVKIYKKYTKLKDIEKKLLADNYMVNGGEECIRLGLADELIN